MNKKIRIKKVSAEVLIAGLAKRGSAFEKVLKWYNKVGKGLEELSDYEFRNLPFTQEEFMRACKERDQIIRKLKRDSKAFEGSGKRFP